MVEIQRLAVEVVGNVLAGRSLDTELRAVQSREPPLSAQDRGALQDICYGTLRFLGEIDALLSALLERPLKDEWLRQLLRVALYQLAHTRAAPYAIVDHAVRTCVTAGMPGAKGLVNAVLRNFLRKRETLLTVAHTTDVGRYSHPQWWIDKMRAQYPAHYDAILAGANEHPPLTLRVNARMTTVEAYLARVEAAGMSARALGGSAVRLERPVPVERIPGFSEGLVSVQDAAAQHAAAALDAPSGSRVLDACAAPGGKTAHILERADVELLALDNDAARLARVRDNLGRLRLDARLVCGDALDPGAWWDGAPFSHVLADVPCSASGVVRRHPDIKWLRQPGDIRRFAEQQQRLIEALWKVLGRGGKLLYVTCSIFMEENQERIGGFVARHPDAHILGAMPGRDGLLLPDNEHDGFYFALLQKN